MNLFKITLKLNEQHDNNASTKEAPIMQAMLHKNKIRFETNHPHYAATIHLRMPVTIKNTKEYYCYATIIKDKIRFEIQNEEEDVKMGTWKNNFVVSNIINFSSAIKYSALGYLQDENLVIVIQQKNVNTI